MLIATAIATSGSSTSHPVSEVEQRRDDRDGQAEPDLLDWLRVQQAVHGGHGDAQCRDDDQRALRACREVLGLAVTVRMVLVGRPCGDGEHGESHQGTGQVDQ
jgi:hypothetical protein